MIQNALFEMHPPPIKKRPAPSEVEKRDQATDRVVENAGPDWRDRATELVAELSGEMTGEDIRLACEARGIFPHHHNAWGGLTMGLVKAGMLEHTGEWRAMKAKGSHARKTPVYRRTP